ncbi:MAG: hypothetical protein ACI9RP_002723 [Cyclobacteriaceae bacterium]|jgi:hypothetical protein
MTWSIISDEDGIDFVTAIEAGNPAIILAEVQSGGSLNGWIDFNREGIFDSTEQVITEKAVSTGFHNVVVDTLL